MLVVVILVYAMQHKKIHGCDKMKCSICKEEIEKKYHNGEVYWDSGHNAQPVTNGRCCDKCNSNIVIPVRIQGYRITSLNRKEEN